MHNIIQSRGTTESLEENSEMNHASTLTSQFFKKQPAIEVARKPYSLEPDIATGWMPKMKIIGPIPLNFDDAITDRVVNSLLDHARLTNYYRVCYLGSRPHNSFKMHQQLANEYSFKYEHLYRNNYSHLQPFYRKFYSQFQNKTNRQFKGMNSALHPAEKQVIFDSMFEGGNLDAAVRVTRGQYDIFLRIDSNTRGHLQWYYFKVKNINLKKIKINIVNFRKKKTLYQRGMKPFIKAANKPWVQGGLDISFREVPLRYEFLKQYFSESDLFFKQLSFTYEFNSQTQEVEFAYCVPYSYSRMLRLLEELPMTMREEEVVVQKSLCQSLSGIDIPLLTITDPKIQPKSKKCIFVIARQHPGQANGSFVMDGFLRWICSDAPQAIKLRETAVLKVVPMMNPDGVILGNFRTSMCGRDLNRLFKSKNSFMYPQVQALKQEIMATKKQFKGRFLLFMDFHGHSVRKNVFTYGPGFCLGENNYYRSRVFPKIIANQTPMFRYYSCSFRISQYKLLTARALICRVVPFCYTVQTSNSSYYCQETRKNVDFTDTDWISIGKEIGVSSCFYLDMLIEEERDNRMRLEKIKEKREMKETHKESDQELTTAKKQPSKILETAKSLTSKRTVRQSMQLSSSTPQQKPPSSIQERKIVANKYNQHTIIDEIKQYELEKQKKKDLDQDSEREYEEGGSDSESEGDDLPEQELKKFYKAASSMMIEFQNTFLKRNNSQVIAARSLNSTIKKKKKQKEKEKEIRKKAKSTHHQEIHVMACLKSRMLPAEYQKANHIEKFKSFQILQPLGKVSTTKLVQQEQAKDRQLNRPLRAMPVRSVNTRNTINDRLERLEMVDFHRFENLQKIEQQPDSHNFSGKVSTCIRDYPVNQIPELRVKDRQSQAFGAIANKLTWLNLLAPRRDRRAQYLQQARQRLQEYLIRENIGNGYDRQFQGGRIRVRNLSKGKQRDL